MVLTAERLRQLEAELTRIKNVSYCSILLDPNSDVSSVDVISDTHRAPQRIVRDAEIILRKHGVNIDHRKIGVVQMEQPERFRTVAPPITPPAAEPNPVPNPSPEAAPAQPAVLQLVPEAERIRLSAVHSTTRDGSFSVEVELVLGLYEGVPGRAEGPGSDASNCVSLVVKATLDAVRNLLQPGYEAHLKEARITEAGGEPVVLVVVDFGRGRDVQTVVGACPQRGTLYDTAVYATLDAINRPVGLASFREVAYLEGRQDGSSDSVASA